MAVIQMTTYNDAVEHLIAYAGGDAQAKTVSDCQRAVVTAYREFNASYRWSYLWQRGRLSLVAPYSTGTITYTHSTRALTLASGTWPTWAEFGTVLISSVAYEVASRDSGTVLTLSVNSNPGANVAAGTSYSIYRDTYPMPCDFQSTHDMIESSTSHVARFVSPQEWLSCQRPTSSTGKPNWFTVTTDPNYMGTMAARFSPRPDQAYSFDFIYSRRPRQLVIHDYHDGTVTTTSGSATVTGTSTAFADKHIGSVIRFGAAGETSSPTSLQGTLPYTYERVITARASATSITVDETIPETLTAVKYRVSDPLDMEEGAMLTAFLRTAEKHLRLMKRMKSVDIRGEDEAYMAAYLMAREADSRSLGLRIAGGVAAYRKRLADVGPADYGTLA